MTPEASFVCALARGDSLLPGDGGRQAPEWGKVVQVAATHQVDALCWWMWRSAGRQGNSVEATSLSRLRESHLHHLVRNESLADDLAALHDGLSERGIEAMCFKGPWLAMHAYPDSGTRPVGDIDLGIDEGDYIGAIEALEAAGYTSDRPLPRRADDALRRAHYAQQLRFISRGRRSVELHFRMINIGPPSTREVWIRETSRQLRKELTSIRVPGPSAMLLHLLLHANQHGYSKLRLLHDIRWALESDRELMDWSDLVERTHRLRCGTSAFFGLSLARDLAGAIVPAPVLEALRPGWPSRARFETVWNLAAVRRLRARRPPLCSESPLLYLFEMGGGLDKVRYAAALLANSGGPVSFLRRVRLVLAHPGRSRGASAE